MVKIFMILNVINTNYTPWRVITGKQCDYKVNFENYTLSAVINCPIPTSPTVFEKDCFNFFLSKVRNRASVILRIFSIFRPFEPHDSYKKNSYKKVCNVYRRYQVRIFDFCGYLGTSSGQNG